MSERETTTRDLVKLLRDLRAVREFRSEPVPEAFLSDAYEVARWTGSAKNEQPWRLVVVRERAAIDALAALPGYVQHLARAPLAIVLVMENQREEIAAFDEGRLAERLMLTALAHGLGSCIGWFAGEGRAQAAALIGAPAGTITRTALSIGYPAGENGLKPRRAGAREGETRKPLSEIVFQERIPG